jgi:hypothetical protein
MNLTGRPDRVRSLGPCGGPGHDLQQRCHAQGQPAMLDKRIGDPADEVIEHALIEK